MSMNRWNNAQVDELKRIYPYLRTPAQVQELARRNGCSTTALHVKAKRVGLERPAQDPMGFDDRDDALLRRYLTHNDTPQQIREVAERMGRSASQVRGRWQQLNREQAARVGDWQEQELAAVVRGEDVPGRSAAEARLRLATLGVKAVSDPLVTLDETADLLQIPLAEMEQAVLEGRLQAAAGQNSPALPDHSWLTTPSRVGAWLVAEPERVPGGAWLVQAVFSCGVQAGRQLKQAAEKGLLPPR